MEYALFSYILPLIGTVITGVCWVALWLKTGHGKGWAMLGLLPPILSFAPQVLLWLGIGYQTGFLLVSTVSSVFLWAYVLFFTFKRWPIQKTQSKDIFQ